MTKYFIFIIGFFVCNVNANIYTEVSEYKLDSSFFNTDSVVCTFVLIPAFDTTSQIYQINKSKEKIEVKYGKSVRFEKNIFGNLKNVELVEFPLIDTNSKILHSLIKKVKNYKKESYELEALDGYILNIQFFDFESLLKKEIKINNPQTKKAKEIENLFRKVFTPKK